MTMRRATSAALGIAALFAVGCANPNNWTAGEVAAACEVERDDYRSQTTIKGPKRTSIYTRGLSSHTLEWRLRAVLGDDAEPIVLVDAMSRTSDWLFLNGAADSNGQRFDFFKVDQVARGGRVEEHVTAALPFDYVRERAEKEKGIALRFLGKRGDVATPISAEHLRGFCEAVSRPR